MSTVRTPDRSVLGDRLRPESTNLHPHVSRRRGRAAGPAHVMQTCKESLLWFKLGGDGP